MADGTLAAQTNVGTLGVGRIFITDDGTTIRFYVACSDNQTNCDYRWSGSIGGVGVGTGSGFIRLNAGFRERLLWAGPVTNNMTVSFTQANTGTRGLGGAASVSYAVNRTRTPDAPTYLGFINVTQTTITSNFAGHGDGGAPILEWQAQIATNAAFTTGVQTSSHPTSGQHTYYNLTKTTPIWGRARGRNSMGWGPWSNVYGPVLTLGTVSDPAPAVAITGTTQTSITYAASNPPYIGESPYKRTVELHSETGTVALQTHVEPASNATFSGLTRGTNYRIRQRIDNKVDIGPWGPWQNVKTTVVAPVAPTAYGAVNVASTSAWSSIGNLPDNGGEVPSDIRLQLNVTPTEVGSTTLDVGFYSAFPITGLMPDSQYYYRMAVSNSAGRSPYGAWVPFKTVNNVPTHPRNLVITSVTDTSALVDWDDPANLLGSTMTSLVLRSSSNRSMGASVQTFDLEPSASNQVLSPLLPATTYYVILHSLSSNGIGSTTAIIPFTTTGTGEGTVKRYWKKINGTWRRGIWWKRINGTWRRGTMWKRINDTWRRG